MKRKICSAAAVLLLVCMLCACSTGHNAKTPDIQTVADKVGATMDLSEMSQIPNAYVDSVMGIAPDGYVSRNTLISAVGTNINEYGIFLAKDAGQANTLKAALSCGFSNLSYFHREFKKKYGMTPKRFISLSARAADFHEGSE